MIEGCFMDEKNNNVQEILNDDFDYFKRWYDFNFNIEKYLSEQHRESLVLNDLSNVQKILLSDRRYSTSVRKELLEKLQLSTMIDYDIRMPIVRFVIDNLESLKKAMVIAGAIFCHQDILKIISKKSLMAVIDQIGQEIYEFIVKRSMMLRKIIPDVSFNARTNDMSEKIKSIGEQILCMSLIGLPYEIKKRLYLVIGKDLDIPEQGDAEVSKKCLELMTFARDKI